MKNWIIISPNGVTIGPNQNIYENSQVLGIVDAETENDVLNNLKKEYLYLSGSGFNEVLQRLEFHKKKEDIYQCHREISLSLFNNSARLLNITFVY